MASLGQRHITLGAHPIDHDSERALPAALARAFLLELQRVSRRGLVKGYQETHESASVVRGRWDVSRQLSVRPGMPLPLEIEYDDFTEDVPINRILHTAVRALRVIDLPRSVEAIRTQLEVDFLEVGTVPRGMLLPQVPLTRLTEHMGTALMLARLILDAVSWTHRQGARRGGTFLVNMATVFEAFVAERLRALLAPRGFGVTAQDRRWWLDTDRSVALRPDIVVADAAPVSVADTKYKTLTDGTGAPPNGDVYQMVAYALALNVPTAHLIYVSGDVISRTITVPAASVDIHVHAVKLSGDVDALEAEMTRLGDSIGRRP
jgi:5-methylcytosine-specific restriction enzyme subunit McrC